MRGFPHLLSSIGFESLLGNTSWFSQSLVSNHHSALAFAQVSLEGRGARLNWLLSIDEGDKHLSALIENLSLESALRGACCLLSAARAEDDLFVILRNSGFCRYGWQRLWQLHRERFPPHTTSAFSFSWSRSQASDQVEIDSLRRHLTSSSVQTVRKITGETLPEFVLRKDGNICGIASVSTYASKVIATPLIAQSDLPTHVLLPSLFARFFPTYQTAYLVQSSDQAWLEDVLLDLGDPVFDREELLVKHFTSIQKASIHVLNHAGHNRHADTITPMIKMHDSQDNL